MSVTEGVVVVAGGHPIGQIVLDDVLILAPVSSSTVVEVVIGTTALTLILSRIFTKVSAGDISQSWIT